MKHDALTEKKKRLDSFRPLPDALDWVKEQVKRKPQSLDQKDILVIHEIILKGIDDTNAGHYRSVPVRIAGSAVVLPNPRKVPDLMAEFEKSGLNLHAIYIQSSWRRKHITGW